MKTTTHFLLTVFLLSLWALSCGPQKVETNLQLTPGHWGHFPDLTTTHPSKMFLSHVKRTETYHICLAKYMDEKYPGIREEIKAGVNIWAHYIGRKIKTQITVADLPEAGPNDGEVGLMDEYYQRCPREIDLVVGFAPFNDSAVGKAIKRYNEKNRGPKKEIIQFKQALFLKQPIDNESHEKKIGSHVVWKTLSEALEKNLSAEEILDLMKKRDLNILMTGARELLTFRTIVHEFGHIWGLCDQYSLSENQTNCDPSFASINEEGHIQFDSEALMSKSNWIVKMYLTDDDIKGIRKLGTRPEFIHDWPKPSEFNQIKAPAISQDIAQAKIHRASYSNLTMKVSMSLATYQKPLTILTRAWNNLTQSWISFGNISIDKIVSYRIFTVDLNSGYPINPEKIEVTLRGPKKIGLESKDIVLEFPVTIDTGP